MGWWDGSSRRIRGPRLYLRTQLSAVTKITGGSCCFSWISVLATGLISAAIKLKCGSCRALARLRRRRHCQHFHHLTHRFRSLAKARQLPQEICCDGWISPIPASTRSTTLAVKPSSSERPGVGLRIFRRRHSGFGLQTGRTPPESSLSDAPGRTAQRALRVSAAT